MNALATSAPTLPLQQHPTTLTDLLFANYDSLGKVCHGSADAILGGCEVISGGGKVISGSVKACAGVCKISFNTSRFVIVKTYTSANDYIQERKLVQGGYKYDAAYETDDFSGFGIISHDDTWVNVDPWEEVE
jgi:hypothetical protein